MSTVFYEVSIRVATAIAEAYRAWLGPHIADMLREDGFLSASLELRVDQEDAGTEWVVRYQVADRAALDHYLTHRAAAMRATMPEAFIGHVTFARRVLQPVPTFDAQ